MADAQAISQLPERQGQPWTVEEDRRLYDGFRAGHSIEVMASVHQRSAGGIRARLRRLGLIDDNGEVVEPPPPFAVPERRRSGTLKGQGTRESKQALRLIFAVTAPDGWRIEIKSNRPLNKSMIERLTLMLQGSIVELDLHS